MPLMSKKSGLNKKVKTFNGNGYEEISTAELVFIPLKTVAFVCENLSKPAREASSIFENFNTKGKIAMAIPIITPKNKIRFTKEMFLPEK